MVVVKARFLANTTIRLKKEAVNYINRLIGQAKRLDKDFNPNVIRDLLANRISHCFHGSIFERYQKAQNWATKFVWYNLDITKQLKNQDKLKI